MYSVIIGLLHTGIPTISDRQIWCDRHSFDYIILCYIDNRRCRTCDWLFTIVYNTRLAAYKGRLRVRPASQRIYINALRRARACVCVCTWKIVDDFVRVYKIRYKIIRYRALPGCVLLVLHTAKRVVTTGALPSAAASSGPSSFPPPSVASPPDAPNTSARSRRIDEWAAARWSCTRIIK